MARNDLGDLRRTVLINHHRDIVDMAKEIMVVAHDILIRAGKKHPQIIRLSVQGVEFQILLDVPQVHKIIDLAVRVAGEVCQIAPPLRNLVQPMNRHNGKELFERPGIGNGLKDGKITDKFMRQTLFQVFKLLGHMLDRLGKLERPLTRAPEQFLTQPAVLQREIAQIEEREHFFALLQNVMIILAVVLGVRPGIDIVHLLDDFRPALIVIDPHRAVREPNFIDAIEDQHGMWRGNHPSGFRQHGRLFNPLALTHLFDRVNDIVGILLDGVIDARLRGRAGAVIINTQAATHVETGELRTGLAQLGIGTGRLLDRVLHPSDFRDLRADVKMQQAQTVEHIGLAEETNTLQEVGCRKAELGQIPARFLPLAAPPGRQFEAEADTRADAQALATRQQRVQLKYALHHNKDALADLRADQGQFDIARVLYPIADNGRVPIVGQRQCNGQLGLAADLKADLVRVSKTENIPHHLFFLVDLDGIGRDVVLVVAEFLDGGLKGCGQDVQLLLDNLGETQHNRGGNAPVSELGHQVFQGSVSRL